MFYYSIHYLLTYLCFVFLARLFLKMSLFVFIETKLLCLNVYTYKLKLADSPSVFSDVIFFMVFSKKPIYEVGLN